MTEKLADTICRSCLEPTHAKKYSLTGEHVNVDVDVVSMLEFCTSSKVNNYYNIYIFYRTVMSYFCYYTFPTSNNNTICQNKKIHFNNQTWLARPVGAG